MKYKQYTVAWTEITENRLQKLRPNWTEKKLNRGSPIFYTGYFIKEIENIFSRVPIRKRNTRGSLGELEIAWNFHFDFSFSQTSTRVSITMETRKMFSIS